MNILNQFQKSLYQASGILKALCFIFFLEAFFIQFSGKSMFYNDLEDTSLIIKGTASFILFVATALLLRFILRFIIDLTIPKVKDDLVIDVEVSRVLGAIFPSVLFIWLNQANYGIDSFVSELISSTVFALSFFGYVLSIISKTVTEEQRKEIDEKRKKRFKIIDTNINDQ